MVEKQELLRSKTVKPNKGAPLKPSPTSRKNNPSLIIQSKPTTWFGRYKAWIDLWKVWGAAYFLPSSFILAGIAAAGILNGEPLLILHGVPLRLWCLYLAGLWWTFFLTSVFVHVIPNVLTLFFGELIQKRLDYYRYMQNYAAFVVVSITADFLWGPIIVDNTINPEEQEEWQLTINRLLTITTVMAISLGAEKTFLQMVAVNFHRTTYQDRIKKSKADVSVLEAIYKATKDKQDRDQSGTSANESGTAGSGIMIMADRRKFQMSKIKTAFTEATTTLGSIASEIFDVQKSNTTGSSLIDDDGVGEKGESVKSLLANIQGARQLARRLFNGVCPEGKKQIIIDDFLALRCFPTREMTEQAFDVFDVDGNGDLSRNEVRSAVSRIFRERKAIADSLRDLDQAVSKLDSILKVFVYAFVVLVGLSYFEVDVATMLATAGSVILGLSFMVGSTAQAIFESCIFLFVHHPYDVGDKVEIEGESYVVREMALLHTVFEDQTGTSVMAPNSQLFQKFIKNIRRSGDMSEYIQIETDARTEYVRILALERKMHEFLKREKREFHEGIGLMVKDIWQSQKIVLEVEIPHKGNAQDEIKWNQRRNKFMFALKKTLEDCGIYYHGKMERVLKQNASVLPATAAIASLVNTEDLEAELDGMETANSSLPKVRSAFTVDSDTGSQKKRPPSSAGAPASALKSAPLASRPATAPGYIVKPNSANANTNNNLNAAAGGGGGGGGHVKKPSGDVIPKSERKVSLKNSSVPDEPVELPNWINEEAADREEVVPLMMEEMKKSTTVRFAAEPTVMEDDDNL